MNSAETYSSNYERHREASKRLGQKNKDAIFDALIAAGINSDYFFGEGIRQ